MGFSLIKRSPFSRLCEIRRVNLYTKTMMPRQFTVDPR
jgi:hypothetical protein